MHHCPDLSVFIYDTNLTKVADAGNPGMVGANYHGKTDVSGKPFRDDICRVPLPTYGLGGLSLQQSSGYRPFPEDDDILSCFWQ